MPPVVLRAAQEAGAPYPWVINRKNNNAIFTHTLLRDTLMKLNDFTPGNSSQLHHLTFQISTKSRQAFPRYCMNLQKLAEFLRLYLFFLLFVKVWKLL